MGQPIKLFDKDGKPITLYAPKWAAEQVEAGVYFVEKPTPKPKRGRPRKQVSK